MKIAVSPAVINKAKTEEEFELLATTYKNLDLTQLQLAEAINRGYSFTTHHQGRRKQDNFILGEHIGLDFDRGSQEEMEAILESPLVKDYHAIFYFTASSTLEAPRFRIVFQLEHPIYDPVIYKQSVAAFIWKFGANVDKHCTDVCRIFYGSKDSNPAFTDKMLPAAVLADVVKAHRLHLEQEQQVREMVERERRKAANPTSSNKGKKAFLDKVLNTHCDNIRLAQKGQCHSTLLNAAQVMGGYLQGEPDTANEYDIRFRLEEAYKTHSWFNAKEMKDSIDDGFTYGRAKPLYIDPLPVDNTFNFKGSTGTKAAPKIDPETNEEMKPDPAGKEKKKSQATILVELAEGEYFHDDARRAFVTLEINGHNETWPVRSRDFKLILNHRFYQNFEGVPGAQAVEDALRQLEARAIFDNPCLPTFYRIGAAGQDTIYLDLANDEWQAVKITAEGWEVVDNPPVKFRRAKGMLPIPVPALGGKLTELTKFINIEKDDLILVIAWLIGSVKPTGPYPGLALNGEQGSAKSGMSRVLKMLIDPASAAIRATPKDEHDMVIAASNSWIVAYDNLSYVQPWQSDCLCRLATGGGLSTRELYSDDQEAIFDVCRPVILNGIEALATRSDLLDRYIVLELPTIPETQRKTEREIMTGFEKARPRILGALLDRVSVALRNQGETKLDKLPRMADFALWAYAALGDSSNKFIEAYERKQGDNSDQALDSSILAKLVIELAEGAKKSTLDGFWKSTPSELLEELGRRLELDKGEKARQWVKTWPQDAIRLSGALKRIAPNLRKAGIAITFDRDKDQERKRFIKIEIVEKPSGSLDDGGR